MLRNKLAVTANKKSILEKHGIVTRGLVLALHAGNNTGIGFDPNNKTWKDLSGNNNNCLITTSIIPPFAGKNNYSAPAYCQLQSGGNTYGTIVNKPSLQLTNTATWQASFKWTSTNGGNRLFAKGADTDYWWQNVYTGAATQAPRGAIATTSCIAANNTLLQNTLTNVAFTFNANTANFMSYINGIWSTTQYRATPIPVSSADLILGNRAGLDRAIDALLSWLFIYNVELTPAEIAQNNRISNIW
jgi:hypothetical protein